MIQSLETAQNWGKKAFKKKFRQADFKKVENLAKEHTFDQKKSKNTGSDAEEIFVATPVGKKRRNSTPESSPKATNAKRSCSQSTEKTGDLNLGSRYRVLYAESESSQGTSRPRSKSADPPVDRLDKRKRDDEHDMLAGGSAQSPPPIQTTKKSREETVLRKNRGDRAKIDSRSYSNVTQTENRSTTSPEKTSDKGHQRSYGTSLSPNNKFSCCKQVRRFPNLPRGDTGAKICNTWYIPKVTKDILCLGTSNFSRISSIKSNDAQVISYPGLKLNSLLRIIDNFQYGVDSKHPGQKPSHVVISVGLNDRRLAAATNSVNMDKIIRSAKKQFPGSQISVYQVPCAENLLSAGEINTIHDLNVAIAKKCDENSVNCIPKLSGDLFEIDSHDTSGIHWSAKCANATMEHILASLN